MQRYRPILILALGFCLALPAMAATADFASFDGAYRGSMTLGPSGVSSAYTAPACANERPAQMAVRAGIITLSYADWHGHAIHYKGRVTADGTVSAYHRNRDGSASRLTGTLSASQFTGETRRGRCDYSFLLKKG